MPTLKNQHFLAIKLFFAADVLINRHGDFLLFNRRAHVSDTTFDCLSPRRGGSDNAPCRYKNGGEELLGSISAPVSENLDPHDLRLDLVKLIKHKPVH
jgi:hypothetical protein